MNSTNNFVKDLQVQCLSDTSEFVLEFRNSLFELSKNSDAALAQILKQCHNLKGNLQAVGFTFCAEFIHELETDVNKIQEYSSKGNFCEQDAQILEFFLSDCLQSLEIYFGELKATFEDKNEYKDSKKYTLKMIADWKPSSPLLEKNETVQTKDPYENFVIDWPEKLAEKTEESLQEIKTQNVTEDNTTEHEIKIIETKPQLTLVNNSAPIVEEKVEDQVVENKLKSSQYLLCKNQGRHFAIPVESVIEIVRYKRVTQMPSKRADMLGLINLRGEALPVLNLNSVLNVSSKTTNIEDNIAKYILVCKIKENIFCFGMEEANEVATLDEETFQPAENLCISKNVESNLVSNYSLVNDKMIMVLNFERALAA